MLRRLRNRTGLLSRLRNRHPLAGILTAMELEQVFQQERARADRSEKCFAMIVFMPESPSAATVGPDWPGARSKGEPLAELVRIVKGRMRIYDSLGQLDARRVALLLPEADSRGAWTFADDVIEACEELGLRFTVEVFCYPIDWAKEEEEPPSAGGRRHQLRIAPGEEERGRAEEREASTGQVAPSATSQSGAPASSPAHAGAAGDGTEPSTGTDGPALAVESSPEPAVPDRTPPELGRLVGDLAPLFVQPLPLARRIVDVAVSGTALILLSPLFAVVAALVKLTSPGPIIFRQQRAGLGGRPFTFYKFRSMYVDAEQRQAAIASRNIHSSGPIFKDPNDPRMTPIGRFLRKSSIDELPQLFNVFKGDMTLIGPRPPKLDEVEKYERWQRRRLEVMGGLTCIWQVSGRSEIGFEDWVRMDIQYQEKRGLLFDLKLVLKTFGAVVSGRGAF